MRVRMCQRIVEMLGRGWGGGGLQNPWNGPCKRLHRVVCLSAGILF